MPTSTNSNRVLQAFSAAALALGLALALAGCNSTTTAPAPSPVVVVEAPAPTPAPRCDPTLARVVDGDTIEVVYGDGVHVKVRLAVVDCPERGHPGFAESTEFTRTWLAEGGALRLTYEGLDPWNRPLCQVWRGDDPVSLSAALLAAGHAVLYEP